MGGLKIFFGQPIDVRTPLPPPPPRVRALLEPDTPMRWTRQVAEGIRKQKDPRQVSRELVNAAREAGSGDDITVVVAKLG